MARFYGSVHGSRGKVSRLGGKSSGLTAIAASYSGAVRAHVYDRDGEDWCRIELMPWKGAGVNEVLYDGPVSSVHRVGLTAHGKVARHKAQGKRMNNKDPQGYV